MNIVFFGSSKFAVPVFEKILMNHEHEVVLCVTKPDRRKGRGLKLKPTPIKESAQFNNVNLLQPEDVNDVKVIKKIQEYDPDAFVLVSYGSIIDKELLDIVGYPLAVHPSLLPKYRGAAPVNHALLNGEEITGVTVYKMNEEMDAGDIVETVEVEIRPDENALELSKRLSNLAGDLLIKVLDKIENNGVQLTPQNEDRASYAPRLRKEQGLIDWEAPAIAIHDKIRGLFPWPGCFTHFIKNGEEQLLKVWESECYSGEGSFNPGEILDIKHEGIVVGTSEGSLLLKTVQPSGKQRMDAYSFVQGARLEIGDKFK